MNYFVRFRRFALLLLSLSLCMQSMAVTSLGACHQVKALSSAAQVVGGAHAQHDARLNAKAVTHHDDQSSAHHDDAIHDMQGSDSSKTDKNRAKCAVCAGCYVCSGVLPAENLMADISKSKSAIFHEVTVPRVRNVASGLERPPRA